MFRYALLLLCIRTSMASTIPKFNFSISNIQNRTGRLYATMSFNLAGEIPLNFYFDDKNITDIISGFNIVSAKTVSSPGEDKSFPIISRNDSTESTNSIRRLPPSDYEFLALLGYYKVHIDSKTWQDALEDCQKEGAHLIIFNSQKEADEIITLLVKNRCMNQELWIGLHDQYNNRNYVTIFNDTLQSIGYTKWYPGDPWGNNNQNCISFRYESMSRYGFRDWGCSLVYPYICEQELIN